MIDTFIRKEQKRKAANTFYYKHKEKCLSGCKVYREKNKEKIKISRLGSRTKDPIRHLLYKAKQRATVKGIEFNITKEDLFIPEKCPILGLTLINGAGTGRLLKDDIMSIDRIDITKGYVKGNVQIISYLANKMKQNATKEQLLNFANWIIKNVKSELELYGDHEY